MMKMTPEQRIKWLILEKARSWGQELPEITAANVDAVYGELEGHDYGLQDAREEIRASSASIRIGLPCGSSRNYEGDAVAMRCPDGQWVGWTYWHGGGKHGEPESMPWISEAYEVEVTEEQKVVTVQTFTKRV